MWYPTVHKVPENIPTLVKRSIYFRNNTFLENLLGLLTSAVLPVDLTTSRYQGFIPLILHLCLPYLFYPPSSFTTFSSSFSHLWNIIFVTPNCRATTFCCISILLFFAILKYERSLQLKLRHPLSISIVISWVNWSASRFHHNSFWLRLRMYPTNIISRHLNLLTRSLHYRSCTHINWSLSIIDMSETEHWISVVYKHRCFKAPLSSRIFRYL